jgi:MFS family permease
MIAGLGLGLSVLFVRDTQGHVDLEQRGLERPLTALGWRAVFWRTTLHDRTLSAMSQAGLVNNLNDGMAWGLLPLYYAAAGLPLGEIGILTATYPGVWAVAQIGTGALSDRIGRKGLIVGGMVLQGGAIGLIAATSGFAAWFVAAVLLGLGTAMVYPTLLATVADVAEPVWRGSAVGVYRLWRDLGFAVGAIVTGVLADRFGMSAAIAFVATLTVASGLVVLVRAHETRPRAAAPTAELAG